MAGYIGSKSSVTQVDGYNRTEADAEFVAKAGGTMTGALIGTDLTLSGGVYLGGTGAANKLDDYESGTWTPNVGGTATYSQQVGQYIKIGTLVHIFGKMTISGIGTGSTNHFSGLPYASSSDESTINISKLDNATFNNYYANLRTAGYSLYLCGQDNFDGTWTVNPNFLTTSTLIQFSGTYRTT